MMEFESGINVVLDISLAFLRAISLRLAPRALKVSKRWDGAFRGVRRVVIENLRGKRWCRRES